MTSSDLLVLAPWIAFGLGLAVICIRLAAVRHTDGGHDGGYVKGDVMRNATKASRRLRRLPGERCRDGRTEGDSRRRSSARPPGPDREARAATARTIPLTAIRAWAACRSHADSLFRRIREIVSSPDWRARLRRWREHGTRLPNVTVTRPGRRTAGIRRRGAGR